MPEGITQFIAKLSFKPKEVLWLLSACIGAVTWWNSFNARLDSNAARERSDAAQILAQETNILKALNRKVGIEYFSVYELKTKIANPTMNILDVDYNQGHGAPDYSVFKVPPARGVELDP